MGGKRGADEQKRTEGRKRNQDGNIQTRWALFYGELLDRLAHGTICVLCGMSSYLAGHNRKFIARGK